MKLLLLTSTMAPVLLLLLSTYASAAKLLDGTKTYQISTAVDYHYMLTLYSSLSDGTLEFHWNPVSYLEVNTARHPKTNPKFQQQKVWSCRLIHKSPPDIIDDENDIGAALVKAPTWLGLAIQDRSKSNNSGKDLMLRGDATIGSLKNGVKQYKLFDTVESINGVREISLSDNAYDPLPFVADHSEITSGLETINEVEGKKAHVVAFDFVLSIPFTERYTEGKFQETKENLFLFAVGPTRNAVPLDKELGIHTRSGAFTLDLSQIGDHKELSYETPIRRTDCKSDDDDYDKMILLPHKTKFYWNLDESRQTIDAQLSHLGNAWLGWGVPNDSRGKMIGSDAIIGRPSLSALDNEAPFQYQLFSKTQKGVVFMEKKASDQETLLSSDIHQDEQETFLRFVRTLKGGRIVHDISIEKAQTFIYAIGDGNVLAKHAHAGHFTIDLTSCPNKPNSFDESGKFKSSWIAHGVFGTLAFAVFIPTSISSAFLRQLIPSTWIYIHVYGNMIAFSCTLIAIFLAISTTSMSSAQHFIETHHKIGLILLLLSLTQVCLGIFRPNRDVRDSPTEKKKREIWKFIHSMVGIIILSLGIYQVGDGLIMFSEDYDTINLAPYYFMYVIVLITSVSGVTLYLFVYKGGEKGFLPVEYEPENAMMEMDRQYENRAYLETEMTSMNLDRNAAATDSNSSAVTDLNTSNVTDLNSNTVTDMNSITDLNTSANVKTSL